MTSLNCDEQVLRTDRRGRVRVPRERREALLAEFARRGVSAAEFARLAGVKYATFAGWVLRQRRRAAVEMPAAPAPLAEHSAPVRAVRLFEAVPAASTMSASALPVELPGGARLLLGEAAQVPLAAELLAALAQRGGRPC